MNQQGWLIGIIGFLLGVGLTILFSGTYYTTHHNGSGFGGMFNMMQGFNDD